MNLDDLFEPTASEHMFAFVFLMFLPDTEWETLMPPSQGCSLWDCEGPVWTARKGDAVEVGNTCLIGGIQVK